MVVDEWYQEVYYLKVKRMTFENYLKKENFGL